MQFPPRIEQFQLLVIGIINFLYAFTACVWRGSKSTNPRLFRKSFCRTRFIQSCHSVCKCQSQSSKTAAISADGIIYLAGRNTERFANLSADCRRVRAILLFRDCILLALRYDIAPHKDGMICHRFNSRY